MVSSTLRGDSRAMKVGMEELMGLLSGGGLDKIKSQVSLDG